MATPTTAITRFELGSTFHEFDLDMARMKYIGAQVLKPRGVGVIVKATHGCMATRGVRKHGISMVTSRMLGAFRNNPTARQEFLAAVA